jgi:glycosyltransferase involved in cell wall biosynthesis
VRIALVSSSIAPERRGGSEEYAANLARALAEAHEVVMFTGATTTIEGAQSHRLPALRDLELDAAGPSKALWHLRDQWLPGVHRALTRGLRGFGPDVVHTQHPQGLSAAVFTAARATDTPHVHTAHDANAVCARISMTKAGEYCGGRCMRCLVQRQVRPRLLSRSLDLLLAPSRYFRDLYVEAGAAAHDRAEVIPQGAPPGTARLRRAGETFTTGFMGALAPHKGIETLLDAFADAPPSWRLRIAGTGPLTERVQQATRADPRIESVGFIEGDDKDAFLDSLDALVIPSEYEENAPLVAVEAAVRGLPSVVSDRGGLPETPGASVFRARDPRHLLEKLRMFADSPSELERASGLLIDEREQFLWSTHVGRVEAALHAVARG